jgi:pilus assembly protein Flp/PilA
MTRIWSPGSGFLRAFRALIKDERGATAIEYSLIAVGISIAAIAALASIGPSLNTMFGKVAAGFVTLLN